MQTILDSADQPAHDAFVEKKSEFIGDACHIDSLDEALAFVQTIRDQHPKARHVAYAAVCGGSDGRLAERMSDDGEPSGTAGKPILDVLRANEMTDCVVAVTRYFGGILLGSGGLIRAYSTGASIAVKAANKAKIVPCCEYQVTLDYPQLGSFQNLTASRRMRNIPIASCCQLSFRRNNRRNSNHELSKRSMRPSRRGKRARPIARCDTEIQR